jgi:hypothetical protein
VTALDGADTAIWLAASPEVEGVTGKFCNKRREISCKFCNPSEADKIWALAEDQVATEPRPERLGGLRPMSVG